MQSSFLLPWPSSSDGGGGLFLPSRKSISFVGLWAWAGGRGRRSADRAGPVAAGTGSLGGEQDHYAVLGLSRSASAADVKRAYRLLARKVSPSHSSSFVSSHLLSVAEIICIILVEISCIYGCMVPIFSRSMAIQECFDLDTHISFTLT